jgi:hypothetical protein
MDAALTRRESLLLVPHRTPTAKARVTPLPIVQHLDVLEQGGARRLRYFNRGLYMSTLLRGKVYAIEEFQIHEKWPVVLLPRRQLA